MPGLRREVSLEVTLFVTDEKEKLPTKGVWTAVCGGCDHLVGEHPVRGVCTGKTPEGKPCGCEHPCPPYSLRQVK